MPIQLNRFIAQIKSALAVEPKTTRYFNDTFIFESLGENAKKALAKFEILKPPLSGKSFKKISDLFKTIDDDLLESTGWQEFADTNGLEKTKEYLQDYRFKVLISSKLHKDLELEFESENNPIKRQKMKDSVAVYKDASQVANLGELQTSWQTKIRHALLAGNTVDHQKQQVPFKYLGKTLGNNVIETYRYFAGDADTKNKGRWHAFKANTKGTNLDNDASFKDLTGDALKSAILKDFLSKLKACTSKTEFSAKRLELQESEQYAIIAKGQGFKSRLFCSKTSTVEAFEKMADALEKDLESSNSSTLSP